MSEEETQGVADQASEPQFEIRKLFVKDSSFESPSAPGIFTDGEWKPEMSVDIKGANSSIGEDIYEVILTITVTAKRGESTAFLIEMQQAGIFVIKNYPEDAVNGILGAYCLETLFPYAREAIDNMAIKGGFPPLILNTINFNAVYQQQQERAAQAGKEATH